MAEVPMYLWSVKKNQYNIVDIFMFTKILG